MTDVQGQVTVTSHGQAIIAKVLGNTLRGQNLAGERLLALSNIEAPLDEGDMIQRSQSVPAEQLGEDTIVVYDSPQAARLHEHPEYNFGNGRKGKYLEDPALQNRAELGAIIATEGGRG